MLNSDLLASQKRLEHRAKAHSDRARREAEKERILKQRQQARLDALEEEKRQRRLAQLKAEEEERAKYEAVLERNNGVFYHARLMAVPAPESIAADKGIKRAADKILLPPSAGAKLMSQDAFKNGALFFELSNGTGRKTHAGLLEFTAAEGFVALPLKVIKCLWGPDAEPAACDGMIDVMYRKLSKGERVVFQPRSADFQESIGDDIRSVLESALLQHSALTEKDWVTVQHGPQTWDMRVRELHPDAAVSIIDTDLEAEINPSIETEDRIRAEEEEAQRQLEETAKRAMEEVARLRSEEEAEAAAAVQAEERRLFRVKRAAEIAATLPPEPPLTTDNNASSSGNGRQEVTTCLFRFPDGGRHSRRFLLSDSVQLMFNFVDAQGASGLDPGMYNLVTSYPRRVYKSRGINSSVKSNGQEEQQQQQTLAEAGFTHSREVLFLEPIVEENDAR